MNPLLNPYVARVVAEPYPQQVVPIMVEPYIVQVAEPANQYIAPPVPPIAAEPNMDNVVNEELLNDVSILAKGLSFNILPLFFPNNTHKLSDLYIKPGLENYIVIKLNDPSDLDVDLHHFQVNFKIKELLKFNFINLHDPKVYINGLCKERVQIVKKSNSNVQGEKLIFTFLLQKIDFKNLSDKNNFTQKSMKNLIGRTKNKINIEALNASEYSNFFKDFIRFIEFEFDSPSLEASYSFFIPTCVFRYQSLTAARPLARILNNESAKIEFMNGLKLLKSEFTYVLRPYFHSTVPRDLLLMDAPDRLPKLLFSNFLPLETPSTKDPVKLIEPIPEKKAIGKVINLPKDTPLQTTVLEPCKVGEIIEKNLGTTEFLGDLKFHENKLKPKEQGLTNYIIIKDRKDDPKVTICTFRINIDKKQLKNVELKNLDGIYISGLSERIKLVLSKHDFVENNDKLIFKITSLDINFENSKIKEDFFNGKIKFPKSVESLKSADYSALLDKKIKRWMQLEFRMPDEIHSLNIPIYFFKEQAFTGQRPLGRVTKCSSAKQEFIVHLEHLKNQTSYSRRPFIAGVETQCLPSNEKSPIEGINSKRARPIENDIQIIPKKQKIDDLSNENPPQDIIMSEERPRNKILPLDNINGLYPVTPQVKPPVRSVYPAPMQMQNRINFLTPNGFHPLMSPVPTPLNQLHPSGLNIRSVYPAPMMMQNQINFINPNGIYPLMSPGSTTLNQLQPSGLNNRNLNPIIQSIPPLEFIKK